MTADLLGRLLADFNWAVLYYFALLNGIYLVIIARASAKVAHHLRRVPHAGYDDTFASPLTPAASVLIPAHDEERVIVESVHATLGLRYPTLEVVVIDDGSTDQTFAALEKAFDLVEVPRVVREDVPTRRPLLSVHVPRTSAAPLVVVRKESSGKSDALNTGLNVARHPLVCMVDADSVLDPDALLHVVKPFVDDPDRVVATGGVVRSSNGCVIRGGRITSVGFPRRMAARIQVVEYLRAFLLGRTGWSTFGMLLVISGAFGLFRRDVVVAAGGLAHDCQGEDAELVVRIHRRMRDEHRPYRMVFVEEPVSWTEVPESVRALAQQRRRWHRGLAETLRRHRAMLFNPRYGRIGLIGLPHLLLFELIAPVVEIAGVIAVAAGLALGVVNLAFAALFVVFAFGFSMLLSVTSLLVEELSFHRFSRWRDLGSALVAAFLENVGFRQATAVWRVQGLVSSMRGSKPEWGEMTRLGAAGAGRRATAHATVQPSSRPVSPSQRSRT